MSEFAQLDGSGTVVHVILADQAFINTGLAGEPPSWVAVMPAGSAGIGYSYDNELGRFVPPGGFPGPSAAEARAELMAMIDAATAPILDAYPRAERLGWDAKEADAAAFMAAEDPEPWQFDLLRSEIAAELAIGIEAVTLAQLAAKAEAVLWLAGQFRTLSASLSGLRKRTEAAIDAAEDAAGRCAALNAARAAIAAVVA